MNQELQLVKQTEFGGSEVDVYQKGDEVFMTIDQLARALEYKGKSSIDSIISRNPYLREGKFSVTCKMQATDGKVYNTRLFTEDGIYEITMLSRQPKAREFRFFVRELLKGLRKGELTITPSYQINDPIERAKRWIEEEQRRQLLEGEVLELTDKVEEYEPKARYVDEILSSTDTMTVTQIAKDYGMTAQQLNKVLNELGVQYKAGGQWVLYAKHAGNGYTKSKTHSYKKADGSKGANVQTRWTQKGRLFLHDVLTANGYVAEMDKEEAE